MEAFLISLTSIATAEMGDRTQLLALVLAARYRKPWPIVAGVLCATLANHAAAGLIGSLLGRQLRPALLDAAVGVSMIAMALWSLKPDKLDQQAGNASNAGAFVATLIAFFLAEMGDKTQIATAVLAAQFGSVAAVVAGTTLGMLLADVPVVLLGNAGARRIPFKLVRMIAAALFALMGVVALVGPLPGLTG